MRYSKRRCKTCTKRSCTKRKCKTCTKRRCTKHRHTKNCKCYTRRRLMKGG